jgi:glycosyltransferase involved in cell wall biosynthesis
VDNVHIDLSIIIKTLNEEKNIENTIRAAIGAASSRSVEIIIADSASTDSTILIAKQYPVTIVRLKNPVERSCGIGAQLGYQVARGRYIYLLDGDMQCVPGFIDEAIEYLESHPEVAGVAGDLDELGDANNHEFQVRRAQLEASKNSDSAWYGERDWLDGRGDLSHRRVERSWLRYKS